MPLSDEQRNWISRMRKGGGTYSLFGADTIEQEPSIAHGISAGEGGIVDGEKDSYWGEFKKEATGQFKEEGAKLYKEAEKAPEAYKKWRAGKAGPDDEAHDNAATDGAAEEGEITFKPTEPPPDTLPSIPATPMASQGLTTMDGSTGSQAGQYSNGASTTADEPPSQAAEADSLLPRTGAAATARAESAAGETAVMAADGTIVAGMDGATAAAANAATTVESSALGEIRAGAFVGSVVTAAEVGTADYQRYTEGQMTGGTAVTDVTEKTLIGAGAGAAGAAIGSEVGGVVGTFIPIPVVGTAVGMAAGAAIGAGVGYLGNMVAESDAAKHIASAFAGAMDSAYDAITGWGGSANGEAGALPDDSSPSEEAAPAPLVPDAAPGEAAPPAIRGVTLAAGTGGPEGAAAAAEA